jgi:hypothetical protein
MSNAETLKKLLESSWISSAAFTKVQGDFLFNIKCSYEKRRMETNSKL